MRGWECLHILRHLVLTVSYSTIRNIVEANFIEKEMILSVFYESIQTLI